MRMERFPNCCSAMIFTGFDGSDKKYNIGYLDEGIKSPYGRDLLLIAILTDRQKEDWHDIMVERGFRRLIWSESIHVGYNINLYARSPGDPVTEDKRAPNESLSLWRKLKICWRTLQS